MDVMNFNNVSFYVVYISGTRKRDFPKKKVSEKYIMFALLHTPKKKLKKNIKQEKPAVKVSSLYISHEFDNT